MTSKATRELHEIELIVYPNYVSFPDKQGASPLFRLAGDGTPCCLNAKSCLAISGLPATQGRMGSCQYYGPGLSIICC